MVYIANICIEYLLQSDGASGIDAPAELPIVEYKFVAVELAVGRRCNFCQPVALFCLAIFQQVCQLLLAGNGAFALS